MLSLAELNASVIEAEVIEVDVVSGAPDQESVNMNDALELLGAAVHLLNYIGNPVLETSVTKREKANMYKLSKKITEFLSDVSPTYLEVG